MWPGASFCIINATVLVSSCVVPGPHGHCMIVPVPWPLHGICASALASAWDLCQCLGLCMGSVPLPWPLHGTCVSTLASAWDPCQCLDLCMVLGPVPWPLHGICASALVASAWDLCHGLWDLCQCLHGLTSICTVCTLHNAHAVVYTDVVLSWFIRQTVLHRKVHCAVYSNCLI